MEEIKLKNDLIIFNNIEKLGIRYIKKYLHYSKSKLESNWWEALNFFFSRSFLRGRRDQLSIEYYFFTKSVLEDYFSIKDHRLENSFNEIKKKRESGTLDKEIILNFKKKKGLGRGNSITHEDFKEEVSKKNSLIDLLTTKRRTAIEWDNKTYVKYIYLGNEADIMMVLDVLAFVSSDTKKKNIYTYLMNKIVKNRLKETYDELGELRAIGDKIATLIIRDIILLNPNIKLDTSNYIWTFPVDTWVLKIAEKIGFKGKNMEEIRKQMIQKCRELDINPLNFAAGLWFLGFFSLEILLDDFLGKLEL